MKTRTTIWPAWEINAYREGRKSRFMVPITHVRKHGKVSEFGASDTDGYDYTFRCRRGLWQDYTEEKLLSRAPLQPGDVVAVRETYSPCWCKESCFDHTAYKATDSIARGERWRSASTMPASLARIRPKVLAVRVGRVCDVTHIEARDEGAGSDSVEAWNGDPEKAVMAGYVLQFRRLWNARYAHRNLGTDANPFCWIYDIERKAV